MRYALCLPRLPRRSPFKYRDRPEDRTGADFTGARDKEFRFFNIQYSLFTRTKRTALLSIFNFQFSIYNSDAFVNIQYSIFNLQFQWLGRETKNFGFLIFNIQYSIFNPYALQSTINNHQSNGVPHYGSPGQGMVLFLIVRLPCSIHEVRSVTHLTGVPIRK